jgi:hypothetical protein
MNDPLVLLDGASTAVVEAIQGGVYPPGRRVQLQVAYCHLVIDHQRAIGILLEADMLASAFALARPTFEALTKGLWLYYCATDEQLEQQAKGEELDQINPLLDDLACQPVDAVVIRSLQQIKSKYWKALCSLTHVGYTQLRHWISPAGVQAGYPEPALHELANFASFMVLAAGRELTLRANNAEGTARLTSLLPERPPA